MVRFASLFNMKEQTVTFISGATYSLEALRAMGMSELLGAMFDFSHKLAVLELNAQELGLFTAVVLVSAGDDSALRLRSMTMIIDYGLNIPPCDLPSSSSDRAGIENVASVEQLQENLIRALRSLISGNHHENAESPRFTKLLLKLPDLRTLNNMHSEKLLSFRIDA